MEDDRSNRRRVTSAAQVGPYIHHLPDILLVKVAGYLTKTSRALLAVALTTDSSGWKKVNWNQTPLLSWLKTAKPKKQPSPETNLVLRMNKWDTLDFSGERHLAMKLSDDDSAAALSCINAGRFLKKLKK